jgi:hypothetical protein
MNVRPADISIRAAGSAEFQRTALAFVEPPFAAPFAVGAFEDPDKQGD